MSLLEILIVLLVLAWVTGGFVVGPAAWTSFSNPLHILLLIVVVLVLVRLVQGKRIE